MALKCEQCGKEGEKAGPCPEEACKKVGKKIKKMCDKSGQFPHGGEPPKK